MGCHVKHRPDLTRNEIISNLFSGKNFNECLKKMEPDHLRDDLRQEVILIICELPEDKVIGLHARKELEFYTVRVMLNLLRNDRNKFTKNYRQQHVELTNQEFADTVETEERELREMVEDMAIEEIDQLYWYNKGLIELYMKFGNFRAVSKETRIPHTTIFKTIKKDLQDIKRKVS